MTDSPWLSVVIPVFNGERYLAAALDSVLQQADAGVELVVSDDGSTDTSRSIIDEYVPDRRVRRIDGPRRHNWVANSNQAVRAARGRWITFLHQDDLWLPGRMSVLQEAWAASTPRPLWLGPSHFVDAAGRLAGFWRPPFETTATAVDAGCFVERLLVQNFIAMPAPVFERSAFDAVGGMDEELWYTADWDLWLKLGAISGAGLWSMPTTAFRIHGQSQTMAGSSKPDSMHTQAEMVRSRHLDRIPDPATRDAVDRAGRFATELNKSLAAAISRRTISCRGLLAATARLGVRGAYRFARDSTILQRSVARLRVGLVLRHGVE